VPDWKCPPIMMRDAEMITPKAIDCTPAPAIPAARATGAIVKKAASHTGRSDPTKG